LDEAFTALPSRRNYVLAIEQTSGEAWMAVQSRKMRGDIRRKMDKMQAKAPLAFHVWCGEGAFPEAAFNALYQQKAAWFKARKETGVFARPEVRDFLRDLAHAAAKEGEVYLAWMTCGDEFVACHMGFIHGGVVYLYNTTYDAGYATFSPGNIMMAQTIKWAADAGLRVLDFMRGDESYKARFAKTCRTLACYSAACTLIGRFALAVRGLRRDDGAPQEKEETDE
jgi:CelD/BcsL family acetyltransferase involved in cellulose biosynthesis